VQLAQVSAVLINSLWKSFANSSSGAKQKKVSMPGSYVTVNAQALTPKSFKTALGKFKPEYEGNEQHDAHEFLKFLLDGLSEDLNRIVAKPATKDPDSNGRPDSELADIWWENHLKREKSIIVSLFTGQFKRVLTCKPCGNESTGFEPFMDLSVPLPEDDHLIAPLVLYPTKDGSGPTKYCVRVKSTGVLRDVLIELAKILLLDEGVSFRDSKATDSGGNDEAESIQFIDPLVLRRAQDLAVVDMRNGYIEKVAQISWKLSSIQNKDTGELPLMHIFELEPLQEKSSSEAEDEVDNSENSSRIEKYGFLALAQRRSEVVSRNYVHPLSHRVFGTPLLIRLDEIEACTGRKLYDIVAKRLRNIVPKTALRFLVQSDHMIKAEEGNRYMDKHDGNGMDKSSRQSVMSSTKTDDESVSAGSMPRYGFRLRVTTRDGRRCLLCPWYRCCIGCQVPDDFGPARVMDGDSIVIDWHFAVDVATSGFGMRASNFDSISTLPSPVRPPRITSVPIKKHSSCGVGKRDSRTSGAITLEECLEAFAKEEQLEAYCSKCKDVCMQTTRLTLWRLPPVLVIHLKRFQYTTTLRRKLRDLVVFPIEGLDVSMIAAPDGRLSTGLGNASKTATLNDDATVTTDDTSHSISGPSSLYDLYAVIHHQGALSGGHYVASIKSESDGQWRLFNDAQIYEIHARDVVDPSAYILFYIRRDMAKSKLADLWNVREESTLSKEEEEELVNSKSDRCVIS
jgi:ubiquitin C-terminal hydrolase